MPLLSGMMLSAHLLIVKLIHASLLLCLLLFCELVILFRLLHLTHRFWLQLKQRHRQRKRQMHDSAILTLALTWLLVYREDAVTVTIAGLLYRSTEKKTPHNSIWQSNQNYTLYSCFGTSKTELPNRSWIWTFIHRSTSSFGLHTKTWCEIPISSISMQRS